MKTTKKRLHFVYAVPHAAKTRMLTFNRTPLYRKYWKRFIWWRDPVAAPFSITHNILKGLEKEYEILLYDVGEKCSVELRPEDRFVGHFWPDMKTKESGNNNWTAYDATQVTNRTILNYPNDSRVFAMTPFNHSTEQSGWAVPLLQRVNRYIGICGDHWVDHLNGSAFSFLQGKISHLNMGICTDGYPRVKYSFNKKGRRKFLYIGRVSKEKNIHMLEAIAQRVEGFEGGYIGDGDIKGWKQIAHWAYLTPAYMRSLAQEYDFFLTTSTFDAQATTVLEAMSWGFVVACTPETGYTERGIFPLSTDNLETNREVLRQLNAMGEDELMTVADDYQLLLREKFTWERFTGRLKKILQE